MNIKFIGLSLVILAAGFAEVIVFNEEVLLALCFIFFVFFAYSYIGSSVLAIFSDRSAKFEADILLAFESKHHAIKAKANDMFLYRTLVTGLSLFELCAYHYNTFTVNGLYIEHSVALSSYSTTFLNQLFASENLLKSAISRNNVQSMIYPAVFSIAVKPYTKLAIKSIK